jgi:hypothetical protein
MAREGLHWTGEIDGVGEGVSGCGERFAFFFLFFFFIFLFGPLGEEGDGGDGDGEEMGCRR